MADAWEERRRRIEAGARAGGHRGEIAAERQWNEEHDPRKKKDEENKDR